MMGGHRHASAGRLSTVACFLTLSVLVVSFGGCDRPVERLVSLVQRLEPEHATGAEPSEQRIEELREDIRRYRSVIEERVEAAGRLGVKYRALAMKYLEDGRYGLAMEAFQEAIEYQPENPVLFYYLGLSAANKAKAELAEEEQAELFRTAERAYQRAVELEPEYTQAQYALAVLYAFELEEYEEAAAVIGELLAHDPENARGHAVRGYVYASMGRFNQAIDAYDRVIEYARDEAMRDQARANQRQLQEER